MIVKKTWTRTILIVAVASLTSVDGWESTSTESSAEYLRKVMLELRDMNMPPSPVVNNDLTGPVFLDVDDKYFLAGKRYSNSKKIIQQTTEKQDNTIFETHTVNSVTPKKIEPAPFDQTFSESTVHNQYYQIPRPTIVRAPQKVVEQEVSGAAGAELAATYNHVFERGNAGSLNALVNAIRNRQLPGVSFKLNQLQPALAQPTYTYYVYPLKSFVNDIRHDHRFQSYNLGPQNTEIMAEESQKEMSNPLFTAISGFIGMAVLFMIGVILLPRLGDFSFRLNDENDYLNLTETIDEAIDQQNNTKPFFIKDPKKRVTISRKPVKMLRPSSVVLLPSTSISNKDPSKKRRKNNRNCKNVPCKSNRRYKTT